MRTHIQSQINGAPVRRQRRPTASIEDRLYRYVPVPPVYRDEDGYLLEDGMSQNDEHLSQTTLWYHTLKRRLPTATVCSDLPMHYLVGNTDATLVPDLFVALQAPPRAGRLSYKVWENELPELVIEMLSGGTSKKDIGPKHDTYEYLGVREYWLFDPAGHRLNTPLVGYRLRDERYQEIAPDAAGLYRSDVLGLDLHVRDGKLRFHDPATGEDLRTYNEAEERGNAERQRADAAERERTAERDRADAEKNRADAAENRADAAERELARLRLHLENP